jgi:hypothetical protein
MMGGALQWLPMIQNRDPLILGRSLRSVSPAVQCREVGNVDCFDWYQEFRS